MSAMIFLGAAVQQQSGTRLSCCAYALVNDRLLSTLLREIPIIGARRKILQN
jgi:hypothetical protein